MSKKTITETIISRFEKLFYIVALTGFSLLIYMLVIQFSRDKVTSDSFNKKMPIEATKGSILAKDGRPLAISIPHFEIRMDCKAPHDTIFYPNIGKLSKELSRLFRDKSAKEYEKDLRNARTRGNKYKKIGNRDLNFTELHELKEFPIFRLGQYKGGLIVIQSDSRENPYGSLASRTIGRINENGEGAGIEKTYNYKLKGQQGYRLMRRQLGDEWIPVNQDAEQPAIDGTDIQTTIDIDLQEMAEKALREQLADNDFLEGGTAVVMETSTGAIRAIANMQKDKRGKFTESFNYAIGYPSDPGSTLKLASLISLLEDGYVTLDTPIDGGDGRWKYYNKYFTDTKRGGYGMLNVKSAFEKSSNVCFAKLMVEHYEKHPKDYINRLFDLKLVERLGLDIDGEGYCTIWTPDDKKMWSAVSLPQMGIGYELLITPMHTLTFYNAIANNGKMVKPYFIDNFQKDGIIEKKFKPTILSGSICSKKTLTEVKKALRGVVENGTAKSIDDDRYQIAGKTGTAQRLIGNTYIDKNGYRKYQASFAGYFPADNPKYSCIVVIYSDKTRGNIYGASWAAPVFKKIADYLYATSPDWKEVINAKGMRPEDNPSIANGNAAETRKALDFLKTGDNIKIDKDGWISVKEENGKYQIDNIKMDHKMVPDVIGMGLRDAIYILENEKYKVKVSGSGRVVSQSPEAGTFLKENSVITIVLK